MEARAASKYRPVRCHTPPFSELVIGLSRHEFQFRSISGLETFIDSAAGHTAFSAPHGSHPLQNASNCSADIDGSLKAEPMRSIGRAGIFSIRLLASIFDADYSALTTTGRRRYLFVVATPYLIASKAIRQVRKHYEGFSFGAFRCLMSAASSFISFSRKFPDSGNWYVLFDMIPPPPPHAAAALSFTIFDATLFRRIWAIDDFAERNWLKLLLRLLSFTFRYSSVVLLAPCRYFMLYFFSRLSACFRQQQQRSYSHAALSRCHFKEILELRILDTLPISIGFWYGRCLTYYYIFIFITRMHIGAWHAVNRDCNRA